MDHKRRLILSGLVSAAALSKIPISDADPFINKKAIPVDGQLIPVIGLGSWLTFDAAPSETGRRQNCAEIIASFLAQGGTMIDSSPMYGYSQDVIGSGLRLLNKPSRCFSATKVWIPGASAGERQMEHSQGIWGVDRFDLLHIHNMLDWRSHFPWLRRWREQGRVRYLGITTSHARRHADMQEVIRETDFDFVQFTYNMADREAEKRLLPLAAEHGKAVVINRPLQGGALFGRVRNRPLPDWADEMDCSNWSQYFLKFVVSHPAVSCAIPATSRQDHLLENMAVLSGRLPSQAMRKEMLVYFNARS